MSIKSTLQDGHNNFESIDSLKADELTIKDLPEITAKLEKITNSNDLRIILSKAVQDSIHEVVEKQ